MAPASKRRGKAGKMKVEAVVAAARGASSAPATASAAPDDVRGKALVYAEALAAAVMQQAAAGKRLAAANSTLAADREALRCELADAKARNAALEKEAKLCSEHADGLYREVSALRRKLGELGSQNDLLRDRLKVAGEAAAKNARAEPSAGKAVTHGGGGAKADPTVDAAPTREQLAALEAQNAQLRSQQEQFRAAMQNLQRRARPDKKHLLQFLAQTFACTGDTALLFSAVSKFCDGEDGAADAAGTLKPLLLVHRVNGADVGLASTAADIKAASQDQSDTESDNGDEASRANEDVALKEEASAALREVIDLTEVSSPLVSPLTANPSAVDDEPKTEANEQAGRDSGGNGQAAGSAPSRKPGKRSRPGSGNTQPAARASSPAASRAGPANEGGREASPRPCESQRAMKRHAAAADEASQPSRPGSGSRRHASSPAATRPGSAGAGKRRPSPKASESARQHAAAAAADGVVFNPIVATPAALRITEADVRRLYAFRPWEAMFAKRPLFSHTLELNSLTLAVKSWLNQALAFRYHYCQELWEQRHWIVVPIEARSKELDELMNDRLTRQGTAKKAWTGVRTTTEALIKVGDLNHDVWMDPFLWLLSDNPTSWSPKTTNLQAELQVLDSMQPERCFYVNDLERHPFYTSHLRGKYPVKHPLT